MPNSILKLMTALGPAQPCPAEPPEGLGKARTGPRPSPSPATPFDGLGKVRTGSRTSPTMPCHALLRARQGSVGLSAPPNHALPCPLRGSAGFGLALQYPQIPKVVRRPFAGRGAWFCLRGTGDHKVVDHGGPRATGWGSGKAPTGRGTTGDQGRPRGPLGPGPAAPRPASSSVSRGVPCTHCPSPVWNPARRRHVRSISTVRASTTVLRQPPPLPRSHTEEGGAKGMFT